jgi:glycosyltransferase involved in cell wall biosynthesis
MTAALNQDAPPQRHSICIIAQQQEHSFGGSEVHTLGLMGVLIEHGFDIELIANRYHGYDDRILGHAWEGRVRIVHTDLDGIYYGERSDRDGWRRVLGTMKSDRLLFIKGNNSYGQVAFLQECRRKFRKIIFVEHLEPRDRPRITFHGKPSLGLWWYKRMVLSRLGAHFADVIVAVSQKVKDRLETDFRYPAKKLVVIRNGVPYRDFARSIERSDTARARYAIPAGAFVFGMLARLSHEKGIDTAIRALRRVVDRTPATPALLVVAGEGSEAESLKNLVHQLRLHEHVRFIGFVRDPEVVVSGFDVILFPSRVEGLPLGLLQGMSAGCVPIVTRISGMPEAVPSSDVGWVVDPDNPEALAEAMHRVLSLDQAALVKMRDAVLRSIREGFDIERANAAFLQIFQL